MWQVFKHFFILGWTSFGGPAAHLSYFQQHFVQRLGWLGQNQYASMVALSQFLPGPGSSQVGFAIGCHRAGIGGGIAAFVGFTFPSFLIMASFASLSASFLGEPWVDAIIRGLKLLAVVIVADACLKMFQSFCRQGITMAIAVLSALLLIWAPSFWMQISILLIVAIIGSFSLNGSQQDNPKQTNLAFKTRWLVLLVFVLLFLIALISSSDNILRQSWSDFYLAGSLVFGGGHVVLPLLQSMVAQSLTQDQFLTAYGLAQALPGPMFTLASYLGGVLYQDNVLLGATIASLAIFSPGLLLMYALTPSWQAIASRPRWLGAISAINAAVVGVLLAALYQPIMSSAVHDVVDLVLVASGFLVLRRFNPPIWTLVLAYLGLGLILSLL